MAKTYGDRWELVASLATGGQGEVFSVRDLAGEFAAPLALKRVLNPNRRARFRAEVEAVVSLNHPNIIKLIDHSALDDDQGKAEKQFLVMPMAIGDLAERVSLYKRNVDSVIQVARQLADALQIAHAAQIIHRDIKPKNILFPDLSHDVWLSDFGICLIRERDRSTAEAEVVGPVQFMAPELEQGGKLEVTDAADVYSLGKVIYYMISGGVTLARERLFEEQYAVAFDQTSARQRLLQLLIGRMISPLQSRISSMGEVLVELDKIAKWESGPLLPAPPKALLDIEQFKQKALAAQQTQERNRIASELRKKTLAIVNGSILDWSEARLKSVAELFGNGGGSSSGVRRVNSADEIRFGDFTTGAAVELWVRSDHGFGSEHILRFSLCSTFGFRIVQYSGSGSRPEEPPVPQHSLVALLPSYTRRFRQGATSSDWSFLTPDGGLHRYIPPKSGPNPVRLQRSRSLPAPSQHAAPAQPKIMAVQFSTEQWPSVSADLELLASHAIEIFTRNLNRS